MNLKKCYLSNNECYKKGAKINPKGFMLHSTGANNPNLKRYVQPDDGLLGKNTNNNHWNQFRPGGRQVCVHGFIGKLSNGDIATYQTLPWNYRGWHSGSTANDTHIGVEICEDGLNDANYFNKVYKEAVELVAYLAKQFNWEINENTVLCHSEGYKKGIASNHADVMHWFPKHGKSMETFRADVKALLKGPEDKNDNADVLYKVQVGAFSKKENAINYAKELKAKGYDTYVVYIDNLYKVQLGAFSKESNANNLVKELKAKGIDAFVTTGTGKAVNSEENPITKGKAVKLNNAALYVSSSSSKVVGRLTGTYYLWDAEVINNRIRVTNSKSNVGNPSQITGWVNKKDI